MKSIYSLYSEIRNQGIKSKYFTKAFYMDFCGDYMEALNSVILGTDLPDTYRKTKASDFYNKKSAEYCHFLEIFYDLLPHFTIDWYADPYEYQHTKKYRTCFPDKKSAQLWADAVGKAERYGKYNRITEGRW